MAANGAQGTVVAVHRSGTHSMSKPSQSAITLVAGIGVMGDAHSGARVKHRSRVAKDPQQPNLRQVHLLHAELLDDLASRGFHLTPGEMGENVTTRGVDLLGLPVGARLRLGERALVELTGLRNPCLQLDGLRPGLMQAVLRRDAAGDLLRLAGVMGVVLVGGMLRPGDGIAVELPAGERRPLAPV